MGPSVRFLTFGALPMQALQTNLAREKLFFIEGVLIPDSIISFIPTMTLNFTNWNDAGRWCSASLRLHWHVGCKPPKITFYLSTDQSVNTTISSNIRKPV